MKYFTNSLLREFAENFTFCSAVLHFLVIFERFINMFEKRYVLSFNVWLGEIISKSELLCYSKQQKEIKNVEPEVSAESYESPNIAEPPKTMELPKTPNFTMVDDLLCPPGRQNRPPKIVVILRGPPGSGKSFIAKLIKVRIRSLNYFNVGKTPGRELNSTLILNAG